MNVAEIVIDLLSDMTTQSSDAPVTLLDPTCGSGSFLAFAIGKGMRVEACDCNSSCVDGSVRNLKHVLGEEKVKSMTNIQLHDSSSNMWKESETEIDCVVADLPWGVNSIEYVEENSRILKSVRARLSTGIPCALVTRDPDPNIFTDSDFEVIGQAYVPPRDFALPKGRKKNQ
jgi:tRNA G10  N-methylase Trm11